MTAIDDANAKLDTLDQTVVIVRKALDDLSILVHTQGTITPDQVNAITQRVQSDIDSLNAGLAADAPTPPAAADSSASDGTAKASK